MLQAPMDIADQASVSVGYAHECLCGVNTEHGKNFLLAAEGIGATPETSLYDYLSQVRLGPRDWLTGFPERWKTVPAFKKARDAVAALMKLEELKKHVPDGMGEMLTDTFGKASPVMQEVIAARQSRAQEGELAAVPNDDISPEHDMAATDDQGGIPSPLPNGWEDVDAVYVRRMRALCELMADAMDDRVAVSMFKALWGKAGLPPRELESREKIDAIARLVVTRAPAPMLLDALM